MRLRQVALVAAHLPAVVERIGSAYDLSVCYRDPLVGAFGLENALLAVGTQFVEVVSPLAGTPATAAARHMARIGGDGGYMVICQAPSAAAQQECRLRAESLGVRVAFEHETPHSRIMQFHPGDTGGSFLEVDVDSSPGGWSPAGPAWAEQVRTSVVTAIAAATVGSARPDLTASTWAAILGVPVRDRALSLPGGGEVRFVAAPVDSLVGVELSGRPGRAVPTVGVGGLSLTGRAGDPAGGPGS